MPRKPSPEPALPEANVQWLDAALERRLHHAGLRRRVHAGMERLVLALGEARGTWLALEPLMNQYHTEREEGAFALGVERGLIEGGGRALRRLALARDRRLAHRVAAIRNAALEAGPSVDHTLAALLEVAWAFVVKGISRGPRTMGRRRWRATSPRPGVTS